MRKYSIFIPRNYTPGKPHPTIVFLHGIGEAGHDGKKCTTVGIGPAIARRQGDFPFIVLFPQVGWDWTRAQSGQLVLDVLEDAARDYAIDRDRTVLSGLSSGGTGTWVLGARYPHIWAALLPLAGHAADDAVPALVDARIPIWAMHNAGDFIVPATGTRSMYRRIKDYGGDIRYTEYRAVGHNCWDKAYDSEQVLAWLQQQRRSNRR